MKNSMRLTAQNVSFHYGRQDAPILHELSFSIEPGSYWCIAGPNGSGKSTLLKLMSGLLDASHLRGTLAWNDRQLSQWARPELARKVAFVPGALKAQFSLEVLDFVLQGRYVHTTFWARPAKTDYSIAQGALEQVGASHLATASITEISAGETQLVMIARAIAQMPQVLILDEATANLDLAYQARIYELLSNLNKQEITILVVSHDLNLAAEFCPNALWLTKGTLYAMGSMEETLSPSLMRDIYGVKDRIEIGRNPHTSRPVLFWR